MTGLSYTGKSCLLTDRVRGYSRLPLPPARRIAFIRRLRGSSAGRPVRQTLRLVLLQLPVLLLVVAEVVLVLDPGDPGGVRLVPRDRVADAVLEGPLRHPLEFALGLRAVDGV